VWALVTELAAREVTVLLTTQYLEEADVLSDSIVILNSGRVVASGTAETLKQETGHSYCEVTVGHPEDVTRLAAMLADLDGVEAVPANNTVSVRAVDGVGTLAEVVRRTDRSEVAVTDISLRRPTLDDVFLHLARAPLAR
jgi:ABC-2 type transport system ATP-binding protein